MYLDSPWSSFFCAFTLRLIFQDFLNKKGSEFKKRVFGFPNNMFPSHSAHPHRLLGSMVFPNLVHQSVRILDFKSWPSTVHIITHDISRVEI